MADFTTVSSSSSSADKRVVSPATGSLCGVVDDDFEDACSICLEPFGLEDPATITSCNHGYHLHCILEWSQRSKECPICWQLFNLKDPASQELLTAVEIERLSRKKVAFSPSSTTLSFREESMEQDSMFLDDSDLDERIMQHLAAMASRVRSTARRENRRSSGQGPSQVHVLSSPAYMSQEANIGSVPHHGLVCGSSDTDTTSHGSASKGQVRLPFSAPFANRSPVTSTDDDDGDQSSILSGQTLSDSLRRATPSEIFSFPGIKSKWLTTSARYKESISKSTQEIKEKLLAHNNSVKELSKGVKREMSAGISGIARMIERLDPNGVPTNLFKGKNVQENTEAETLARNTELDVHGSVLKATADGSTSIEGLLEVSHVQREH